MTTLYSGSGAFLPTDIAVDPGHGIFYAAGHNGDVAGVFEGSVNGGTTLTSVVSMSNLAAGAAAGTTAPELVLVTAPTVTTSGTVTAITNGGAVTIDAGAKVADTSSQLTAGASIVIVGSQTGDVLNLNNGGTLTFGDGNQITSSFDTGTETLTLKGNATAAEYQTALDRVAFNTASNTATPRTIDWTVSDGVVSSAIGTSTVQVHVLPTVTAGATATFKGGGGAVQLDPALTVTDPSSATLANATVSIGAGFLAGDVLGVTDQNGITGSYKPGPECSRSPARRASPIIRPRWSP